MNKYENTKVINANDFLDKISEMSGLKFITYGYIRGINLNYPKSKHTKGISYYMLGQILVQNNPQLKQYINTNTNIGGIIKYTTYNIQYFNANEMKTRYKNYTTKQDKIVNNIVGDIKKNINPNFHYEYVREEPKYQTDTIEHGNGGISVYNGKNPKKMGNGYINQNTFYADNPKTGNPRKYVKYYLIDILGKIICELSVNDIKPLMQPHRVETATNNPEIKKYLYQLGQPDKVFNDLKKLQVSDEYLLRYVKEMVELKFKYKRFDFDKILFMCATSNNEQFIYINDNLQSVYDNLRCNLNKEQFFKMVEQHYNISRKIIDYPENQPGLNSFQRIVKRIEREQNPTYDSYIYQVDPKNMKKDEYHSQPDYDDTNLNETIRNVIKEYLNRK